MSDPQWLTDVIESVTITGWDWNDSAERVIRAALPAIREGLAAEIRSQAKNYGHQPTMFGRGALSGLMEAAEIIEEEQ
jgi:hypothetical protein